MEPTNNQNSVGPTVAIIIVLAMVILGGIYFWGERSATLKEAYTSGNAEEVARQIETQSISSDTDSIENDLEDTEIEDLDSGLEDL